MGYCYRCWKWKGIKKETAIAAELEGEGWRYLCLGCLNETAKPMPLWFYPMLWFFFAFLAFIFYQAGKQVGVKNRP
jgi:hypothetical protein